MDNFKKQYWRYYLMLERKFINTLEYVELNETKFLSDNGADSSDNVTGNTNGNGGISRNDTKPNFSNLCVFSNEYAHLIQAIGSELDCFIKFYCGFDPKARFGITDYANSILDEWPQITEQVAKIVGYNVQPIKPFNGWNVTEAAKSLTWWNAFNKIKHSRVENMTDASLKNTLYILAGLYILEKKYIQKIARQENRVDVMRNDSEIFILENWTYRFEAINDMFFEKCGNNIVLDANRPVQTAQ